MFPRHAEFDTTTVVDAWHKSGEKGKEKARQYTRGQKLIAKGQLVEKFYIVADGTIQPYIEINGSAYPEPKITTSIIAKPPKIAVIGARAFFTRDRSDRDWYALDHVAAYEVDSKALMTKYHERDPKTRLPAVWTTVRALVCVSDISDVLKEIIGGQLGVDPSQGFADKQYDRIFSAFPEYPKLAMETIYQMLKERDKDVDEPSLVSVPPQFAAAHRS